MAQGGKVRVQSKPSAMTGRGYPELCPCNARAHGEVYPWQNGCRITAEDDRYGADRFRRLLERQAVTS